METLRWLGLQIRAMWEDNDPWQQVAAVLLAILLCLLAGVVGSCAVAVALAAVT